jgi:transcriptional regulator with XRE-family HTH domain
MSTEIDPTQSAQASYAVQLKRQRTARRLSQPELGQHPKIMVSGKTISAVETMQRPPTSHLSIGADEALETVDLFQSLYAAFVRESGLPAGFLEYAEQEARARQIKIYESLAIPGFFQIEPYAREILGFKLTGTSLETAVSTRIARQDVLDQENPPEVIALIEEAAWHRFSGTAEVLRAQVEHLRELTRRPNVTVQVVPKNAPVYPEGAFTLLSFDGEPDLAYVESAGGKGRMIEAGTEVTELSVLWDRIRGVSLPTPNSATFIGALLEDL